MNEDEEAADQGSADNIGRTSLGAFAKGSSSSAASASARARETEGSSLPAGDVSGPGPIEQAAGEAMRKIAEKQEGKPPQE